MKLKFAILNSVFHCSYQRWKSNEQYPVFQEGEMQVLGWKFEYDKIVLWMYQDK